MPDSFLAYEVWYRHDAQPEIRYIPMMGDEDVQTELMTLDKFTETTKDLNITHMHIEGKIPPSLEELAPNLKQLRLRDVPHHDQLARLVVKHVNTQC